MPFDNLNNNHYTAAEKTAATTALNALETALTAKFKNLSADERKKYGSINEQNKLIVNKEIEARWVCFVLSYDEGLTIKPSTLTNVFNTG